MRAKLMQILWHAKPGDNKNEPIFGLDVHPTLPLLATAGADNEVRIWKLKGSGNPGDLAAAAAAMVAAAGAAGAEGGAAAAVALAARGASVGELDVEFAFTIAAHVGPVNAVRFSPNGQCLASAGDDKNVNVYYPSFGRTWETVEIERHLTRFSMRGHASDIYDISWSPDSLQLVSGAVDNTAIVWDVVKGRAITRLEGHSQFVQGVAWDPAGTYIATQSNDRTARVFAPVTATKGGRGKKVAAASASAGPAEAWDCAAVLKTRQEVLPPSAAPAAGAAMSDDAGPAAPAPAPATRPVPLFLDETVPSFFRRPAWSPDGSLVFFPTGIYRPPLPAGGAAAASAGGAASSSSSAPAASASALAPRPTTFAFRRDAFTTPVAHFPGTPHTKATIAVRVAPVVYKLRGPADGPGNGSFTLPYRMRFAVASLDTVFIYDTESPFPEAVISGFHCEKISDIAWSGDGSLLFVSSIDGYASVVAFSSKDTGVPLPESDPAYPPVMLKNAAAGPTFVPKQPKHAGAGGAGGAAGGAAGEEGGAGAAAMGEGAAAAAVSTSAAAGADGVAASTAGTSAAAGGATVNVLQPRKRAVLIPVAVEGGAAAVAAPAAAPPAAPAPAPAPPAEAAPPAASDASAMTDE